MDKKYIPSKYGICKTQLENNKCVCKQKGYAQEMCENYTPVQSSSWQELAEYAKTHLYKKTN